jgi:hypothetical protein
VNVHPGVTNSCVDLRKQASLYFAWIYIQATIAGVVENPGETSFVCLYIQGSLAIVWISIQACLTVVWL